MPPQSPRGRRSAKMRSQGAPRHPPRPKTAAPPAGPRCGRPSALFALGAHGRPRCRHGRRPVGGGARGDAARSRALLEAGAQRGEHHRPKRGGRVPRHTPTTVSGREKGGDEAATPDSPPPCRSAASAESRQYPCARDGSTAPKKASIAPSDGGSRGAQGSRLWWGWGGGGQSY